MADIDVGSLLVSLRADLTSLQRDVKGIERTFDSGFKNVERRAERFGSNLNTQFKGLAVGLGRIFGVITVGFAARGIVQAGAQVEALRTRLEAMTGSAEEAARIFQTLSDIAVTTPFGLKDVAEAGVSLRAFGADAEATIKPVADLAVFMGVTIPQAAQAFGRAFAQGAGAADILRDRGILRLVADFNKIDDLTKVSLPEFRKALLNAMQDPAAGIAGATDKLAKTWTGAFSNMQDAVFNLGNAIAEAGILEFLTEMVKKITESIEKWTDLVRTIRGGLTPRETMVNELDAVSESILRNTRALREARESASRGSQTAGNAEVLLLEEQDKLLGRQLELLKQLRDLDKKGEGKPPLEPDPPDPAIAQALDTFRNKLQDQIAALEINRAELQLTAEQAEKVAQAYDVLGTKADLVKNKKPVPREIASLAREAETFLRGLGFAVDELGEKDLRKLIQTIGGLTGGLARAKFDADQLKQQLEDLNELEPKPFELPLSLKFASGAPLTEAEFEIKKELERQLKDISITAEIGAIDINAPGGAELKRITEIKAEFARVAEDIKRIGNDLGLSQEEIAKRIDEAFNAAFARISEGSPLEKLKAELRQISLEADTFGVNFNNLEPSIAATTAAIRELLRQDPVRFTNQIRELNEELRQLTAQEELRDTAEKLIRGAASGISDSLRSIALGTQSVEEAFKNMGIAAVTALADTIFQLLIIEPLVKSVRAALSDTGSGSDSGSGNSSGIGSFFSGIFKLFFGKEGGKVPAFADGGAVVKQLAGGLLPAFADGGEVPAILHKGEFVFSKPAVDEIGSDELERVHKQRSLLPKFEFGGRVPSTAFHVPRYQTGGPVGALAHKGGTVGVQSVVYNVDARGAERGVSREVKRALMEHENRAVMRSQAAVTDERRRSNNAAKVF